MDKDRARQTAAASGFGVLLAIVTGATAIGVAIVAALGAALAWAGYRKRQ